MFVLIIVSIAIPVCLVLVIITCLNCFQKTKFQSFQDQQSDRAHNNPSFTIDITDSQGNEHVAIEPLPDILAKTTTSTPLRPKIICSERSKQDTTLSLISVHRSFPREQLQYLNEVESGWFGKVLDTEATKILSGSEKSRVMVKMLKDDASKAEQKQFLDEVLAFRCLQHTNVLGLLGQCIETSPFLILLEFAPHGNLKTFLTQRRLEVEVMLKRHMFLEFAVDAAAGLACLHRHGYVHNDLAARNCLVMSDFSVKIGDYGISEVLFKEDYMMSGSDLLPIRWMAPESLIQSHGVWTAQPGDKVSDMWAFGVLLWEIFSFGERPYDMLTDEAMLQGVVLDKLVKPAELDTRLEDRDKLWQLLCQCWQDPAQRVEIEQLHQQLDHLMSAARDTFEVSIEFDQRWRELQPNKRASSVDSRIPLAGSFAGSTLTERSSVASVSTELMSDFTSSTDSKAEPILEKSPAQPPQVLNGSGDRIEELKDAVALESSKPESLGLGDAERTEPSKIYENSVTAFESQKKDLTPFKPVVVASSTPCGSKQDDTSEFFSPLTSTPASLYSTAIETSSSSMFELIDNSTLESTDAGAEVTFLGPGTTRSEDSIHPSRDNSDRVRTSPNTPTLDFGDFKPLQSVTVSDISSGNATIPKVDADFSEFESDSNNLSIIETKGTNANQSQELESEKSHKEEENSPQKLTLQFESMSMDSFAEEKEVISSANDETGSSSFVSPTLLTPVTNGIAKSELLKEIQIKQELDSGPLLDKDVDQLVPSSNEPVQHLLESAVVSSLPSEPELHLVHKEDEPMVQPMGFADVLEQQQSLEQNLDALPAHTLKPLDRSKDSLLAVLGESLESQSKLELPSGNPLHNKVTADSSSFKKVSDTVLSSMAEWDLLGQEASSSPNLDTAKENSSSPEPGQAS